MDLSPVHHDHSKPNQREHEQRHDVRSQAVHPPADQIPFPRQKGVDGVRSDPYNGPIPMSFQRRFLIFSFAFVLFNGPTSVRAETAAPSSGILSETLPLTVSGVFIGMALWVSIRAWNEHQHREHTHDWSENRLPEEVLKDASASFLKSHVRN